MATHESAPDKWTYALIQAKAIIYAFKSSPTSYFADIGGDCYTIPMDLWNILMSLNIPHVFKAYNEDLKNSKKKRWRQRQRDLENPEHVWNNQQDSLNKLNP